MPTLLNEKLMVMLDEIQNGIQLENKRLSNDIIYITDCFFSCSGGCSSGCIGADCSSGCTDGCGGTSSDSCWSCGGYCSGAECQGTCTWD